MLLRKYMITKNKYHKKKRIIFFCDDPAGGVILGIIIKEIAKDHDVFPCFTGPSEKYIDKKNFKNNNLKPNTSVKKLEKLILKIKPNLMITAAGIYNMYEHNARLIAKKNKIISIAIIDYWCEYSSRFQRKMKNTLQYSYPDWVFIMDKKSKKDFLIETNFEDNKTFVSGSINLEAIFKNFVLRKKYKNSKKNNNIIITFFSDAFFTQKNRGYEGGIGTCFDKNGKSIFGYTPDVILDLIIENLLIINKNLKKKIKFIIKPHPRESIDALVPIPYKFNKQDKNIKFYIELNKNSENLIFSSDLIFGMGSVALFEAGIASKPSFSVQIGINRKKIYDPCISNYFNYSIKVDTKSKLKNILREYLINPKSRKYLKNKKNVNLSNALSKTIKKINNILLTND